MKLLIASNNKHKIEEIKAILNGKFEQILSLDEADIHCDPEENGATFEENATIKATEIAKHTDMAVLADDTGLCVDALGGAPGVFSARYAGNHDFVANRKKLLEEMKNVANRTARFETAVVLRYPDGRIVSAKGLVRGKITEREIGDGGFGYDCVFYCDELGKTFGEATPAEKNQVSHRARALANLLDLL